MYLYHFGLQGMPFGLTPDTRFFCALPGHRAALNVLYVATASGEGFVKITGEVGIGKTLLCRRFLAELDGRVPCAWLPNPILSPHEMRLALAHELGLKISARDSDAALARKLELHLLELARSGRPAILLIDEAQALPDETLEALRLLSNLETERYKLLQIVLFGQAELDKRLARDHFRQLRQRIAFTYSLPRLRASEMQTYLDHRLRVAGSQRPLFSTAAMWLTAVLSGGIPRLGHILAHKALLLAYGRGLPRARLREVWAAAFDTEDVVEHLRRYGRIGLTGGAGLLAASAAIATALRLGL
jgi:MSHA biogenesis protein MshM